MRPSSQSSLIRRTTSAGSLLLVAVALRRQGQICELVGEGRLRELGQADPIDIVLGIEAARVGSAIKSLRLAQHAFEWLDGPVHRFCCPDTPVPYSPTLEEAYLPNVDKLVAKVRELAAY